jgi:hypothetical protein
MLVANPLPKLVQLFDISKSFKEFLKNFLLPGAKVEIFLYKTIGSVKICF